MAMSDSIHNKHRQRMREKLLRHGGDIFEPHELLEMLLYSSIARVNTNPTAHALLQGKTCMELLESGIPEIMETPGVGEVSAYMLKLSGLFAQRAALLELEGVPLENDFQRRMYLSLWYKGKGASVVTALLLDEKDRVLAHVYLSKNRYLRTQVYSERIVELAKEYGAASVILAHNHANGVREPSVEDICVTEMVRSALSKEGVAFLAHYIITATDCIICP